MSLHADLLAADPADSGGVAAGAIPDQSVAPGEARTATRYASPEVGEGVAMLRDQGDPINGPAKGLYGAVVVTPPGAVVLDATTGERLADSSVVYGVVRGPYTEAGIWGLLRVLPADGPGLRPLPCAAPCSRVGWMWGIGAAAAASLLLALVIL